MPIDDYVWLCLINTLFCPFNVQMSNFDEFTVSTKNVKKFVGNCLIGRKDGKNENRARINIKKDNLLYHWTKYDIYISLFQKQKNDIFTTTIILVLYAKMSERSYSRRNSCTSSVSIHLVQFWRLTEPKTLLWPLSSTNFGDLGKPQKTVLF